MAAGTEETLPDDDPGLEGGEWLFRRDGQVFGPIDSRQVAAMLYRGELDAATPISAGDGAWRPVAEVSTFRVHAKKAEAGLRVEREVTGARLLRARQGRRRLVAAAAAAILLVAAAVGGVVLFARRTAETSPLLEDFGAGIRIASAARVGVSRRGGADELVEVPLGEPGGDAGARPRRAAESAPGPQGRPAARGEVTGEDFVAAHFDERRIQAVVSREQRNLAPCFRDEAARSPDFQGTVPIEFVIDNDGRVAQLWIDEPRFRNGALKECLAAALARWRFEPFPGQRPTVGLAFGIGP